LILDRGGEWYSGTGTKTSKGTKIFSLVGKVRNSGLVEVPMGISISEIVYDIGGGAPDGKQVKAVQIGGPSGGCIPRELFHLPIDYESLTGAGAIMGSGGLIVMDEDTCMVDVAKYFMNFLQDESCGKCSTCREGTQRMHEILTGITKGRGRMGDMELLEELGGVIRDASMCGLGQTAPNPVLSTLRYFRDEYARHIERGECPARHCKELIRYTIDTEKCTGCGLCSKNCPEGAISGELREPHAIDPGRCVKCGICLEKCKFDAVMKTTGVDADA
jgi:NADH:ubiquinone oxidoreductase subunit F (NADH-binding)/Pyruvate/2-oxoacid:ferredoxin oxidoreductase delta subunit